MTRDAQGHRVHELRGAFSAGRGPVELVADDADPAGLAGAFHILDALEQGLDAARRWSGATLPELFVYWGRGVTTEWSFYRGERPRGSGRYALELLGVAPEQRATADSDEHDEAIVLHELGHFVMDRLSGDSSPGGAHPRGALLDPGLAWEEGRATWFAAAVLGDPSYRDAVGMEPSGNLRIDHDLERGAPGPRGNGSETSVAEVLWDLADGAAGIPDADDDGIALGPEGVLRAMIAQAREPGVFPCLATYLRSLVAGGVLEARALRAMLRATGQPEALLPGDDTAPWPRELPLPGLVRGRVDGLSDPAPSGGAQRPENGFDAVRAYRIRVPVRGRLVLRLRIRGTGKARDRQDLDLELRSIRAVLLAAARAEAPVETVARRLEPGWYVVYVRDGGSGNRADYELSAELARR